MFHVLNKINNIIIWGHAASESQSRIKLGDNMIWDALYMHYARKCVQFISHFQLLSPVHFMDFGLTQKPAEYHLFMVLFSWNNLTNGIESLWVFWDSPKVPGLWNATQVSGFWDGSKVLGLSWAFGTIPKTLSPTCLSFDFSLNILSKNKLPQCSFWDSP